MFSKCALSIQHREILEVVEIYNRIRKIDLQENNNPQSRFSGQNVFALQNNMVPMQQSTSGIQRQNFSSLSANNSKLNINRQAGVTRSHISTVSQGARSRIRTANDLLEH